MADKAGISGRADPFQELKANLDGTSPGYIELQNGFVAVKVI